MPQKSTIQDSPKRLFTVRFRQFLTLLFVFSITLSAHAQLTLRERLEQHVFTLAADSLQGRKAGTIYARKAADYIVRQWEEIGIEPFFDTTFLQVFGNGIFQNVVGIIRGNDSILKKQYIVIGAHFDHLGVRDDGQIYSGADDNASGVATLIELGRKLHDNQSNLKRSIILIAFDAEEIGLIGADYFITNTEIPIEQFKLMLSIDMVGWYRESGQLQYVGSGTIRGGAELILNPELIPEGLNVVATRFERGLRTGTDTWPFAEKGIPTLHVTTGLVSPFHEPEDEAHLIDLDGMVLITEHLKNLMVAISNDREFGSSGRIARRHRLQPRFIAGVSANVGSNRHRYSRGAVNGKQTFSYGVGLMTQVNFGRFAFRPEVHLDRIRARHPDGMVATDNLTVPVSLVLQTVQRMHGADFFIGAFYSHRLRGTHGGSEIDFAQMFNRQETGLTFGFGFWAGPFRIGYTNRFGLTSFNQNRIAEHGNANLRNRTNYFTVTFLF